MPIYEFECKECGKAFEHLAPNMQDRAMKVSCPHCQSKNTLRKVSVFAVANAQQVSSSPPNGGGCCCGAGGCGSH